MWTKRAAAAAVIGLSLASGITACGFSDTLTRRGFISQGDQICIDTVVKTGVGLHARRNVTASEFLGGLGTAYAAAATKFRGLQVSSDDEAMRNRVAADYSAFAQRFGAASHEPANVAKARAIFADLPRQQAAMKAYGFVVCGGGGSPQ